MANYTHTSDTNNYKYTLTCNVAVNYIYRDWFVYVEWV